MISGHVFGILIILCTFLHVTSHHACHYSDVDAPHALSRLTESTPYPIPSLGTVVTSATSKLALKPEEAPIANDLLNKMLLVGDKYTDKNRFHLECMTPVDQTKSVLSMHVSRGSYTQFCYFIFMIFVNLQ